MDDAGPPRRLARMLPAWWPVVTIVALAVLLRLWAYAPLDISHADELMQYIEQANRLATGTGILPWETRVGLRNSLIPHLLSVPMALGHALAPGTLAHVHLARLTFMALTLIALPAAWRLGRLSSDRHALIALLVAGIWWESVLYSDLLLSESLAAALLLLAASLLLDPQATPRASVAAGTLLGLGVLVRLQYAPFALVLLGWTVAREPRRSVPVLLGGALAAVLGCLSDWRAGVAPFSWIWINVHKNIGEGIAARFGTSPAWQYLADYYLHFGAGALLFVMLGAGASGSRYRPLLAAAAVNIAVHSMIAHKEYRFVWASTLVLVVLAGIGSVRILDQLRARHPGLLGKPWRPMLALAAMWALLSASSFQVTGGFRAFRGGGAISRLAIAAAEQPGICRLAVVEEYYVHVVPALLPRTLPLSIAPKGVYTGEIPLPAEIARAADALLAERRPLGTQAYQVVACLKMPGEVPCLYVRPGSCTPDPRYNYQTALTRGGM